MITLTKIALAIKQPPIEDGHPLKIWLQNYSDDLWDQQIAEHCSSGKLNKFIAKVETNMGTHQVKDIGYGIRF